MGRKNKDGPTKTRHELSRRVPSASTLADFQQVISDFRGQGAPEHSSLSVYSSLYPNSDTRISVSWVVSS